MPAFFSSAERERPWMPFSAMTATAASTICCRRRVAVSGPTARLPFEVAGLLKLTVRGREFRTIDKALLGRSDQKMSRPVGDEKWAVQTATAALASPRGPRVQ